MERSSRALLYLLLRWPVSVGIWLILLVIETLSGSPIGREFFLLCFTEPRPKISRRCGRWPLLPAERVHATALGEGPETVRIVPCAEPIDSLSPRLGRLADSATLQGRLITY